MKINSNYNNVNFKSRNAEIRFADNIARKVNREYPRISSTKVKGFNNINKFEKLRFYLNQKINSMRSITYDLFNDANSFPEQLSALTSNIKKFKVGNCGEATQLAEIAARLNGIQYCSCRILSNADGEDIDHEVLLVHNNGKPYIIDAWLGFADYCNQAIERYRGEYRKYFDKKIESKVYFDGFLYYDPTGYIFSEKYSENDLKRLYPELVIEKVDK